MLSLGPDGKKQQSKPAISSTGTGSRFRPVRNMLESASWERSREMRGKGGCRMELSGMLKGHTYVLVVLGRDDSGSVLVI